MEVRRLRELVATYDAAPLHPDDMIVDTGDLTDFGSPPETAMVQGIRKIGYPYVFVAGNHDSQTVMRGYIRAAVTEEAFTSGALWRRKDA